MQVAYQVKDALILLIRKGFYKSLRLIDAGAFHYMGIAPLGRKGFNARNALIRLAVNIDIRIRNPGIRFQVGVSE
jgi:hypothetical protein